MELCMKHSTELLLIKVTDLVPSPHNVRRHSNGAVDELAALIAAQGLLHPLVVTEQAVGRGARRSMRFGVVAGERRRRALVQLQAQGHLPADHAVHCELVPPERASEVSLAENSGREPMHPADEFEAFHALVARGKGIEDVAAAFGVSPRLRALYREEGINLDQLMALALTDDHALQERTWFDARPWEREPAALRRALTQGEVQASGNALVRFVGIDAYEAAGGVVRRDLFDSEQAGWLSDPDLLRRLATEKLEGVADLLKAEGWSWVETRIEVDSHALRQFSRCEPSLRALQADEREALDEMKRRETELDAEACALDEAMEWSAIDAERLDLEEQDIAARRSAIQVARQVWRAEDKAVAGVIVTVHREGDAEIFRGLVRVGDRRKAATRKAAAIKAHAEEGGVSPQAVAKADRAHKPAHSDALMRRLTAHKTAALQATLAGQTHDALVALAHALALKVFERERTQARSALQLSVRLPAHELVRAADDLVSSPAWAAVAARRAAWLERLPGAEDQWFTWLAALPQDDLFELLGFCAACTANALSGSPVGSATPLVELVGLDMATWWQPTPEGYLSQVSKAQIVDALKEAVPDFSAASVAGMKKGELVARAVAALAGTGWLPEPLRRGAA
jgi:ParB family transcriptional regulator, chromosome partitioning protein